MKKLTVSNSLKKNIKSRFHSLCRNFNNFDDITNEDIEYAKEVANEVRNKYDNYSRDSIYFKYLNYISENYYNYEKKDMLPLILIMTVDPTFMLYKIYEKCSKVNEIKSKMKFVFGFYDIKIISYENAYIKKFLNLDDFSFTKRLEL